MTAREKALVYAAVCDRCHGRGSVVCLSGGTYRAQRRAAGLTGRDVCRKVGISAAYLSDIELGRRQPSPETRRKLLAVIGSKEEK